MKKYTSEITGNLDIFFVQNEDDWNGETIKLADANQNDIIGLPIGAREHVHLRPKYDLSNSSEQVIVGRLDAKGTGAFYDRYIPRKK